MDTTTTHASSITQGARRITGSWVPMIAAFIIIAWMGLAGCGSQTSFSVSLLTAKTLFANSYNFLGIGGNCSAPASDPGESSSDSSFHMYIAGWQWTQLPAGAGEPEIINLNDNDGLIDVPNTVVAFKPEVPGTYTLVLDAECPDGNAVTSKEITFEVVDRAPLISVTTLLSPEEQAAYEDARDSVSLYDYDFDGDGDKDRFRYSSGGALMGTPEGFGICYYTDEDPCAYQELSLGPLPEGISSIASIVGGMPAADGSFLIYAKTQTGFLEYAISRFRVDVAQKQLLFHDTWSYKVPHCASDDCDSPTEVDAGYNITMPGVDVDGDGVLEFVMDDVGRTDHFFETIMDFVETEEPASHENAIALYRGDFLGWSDHNDDGNLDIMYKIADRIFVLETLRTDD